MAQLLAYREDMWAKDLGQMGFSLGRFIYLLDAAADYDKDKRKGKYNPYLAMGMEKDEALGGISGACHGQMRGTL